MKVVISLIATIALTTACSSFSVTSLNDDQKKIILDKHNELRQYLASGQESSQPTAANMELMTWSEDLASGAQDWANQCQFMHSGGSYGENLAEMMNSQDITPSEYYLDSLVQMWYDEVSDFDSSEISPFQFNYSAGHYTQVEWAASNQVGCGVAVYVDQGWNTIYMVCRYLEAGNMMGGTMYEVGSPCSDCPSGTSCDSDYDALCSDGSGDNGIGEYISKPVHKTVKHSHKKSHNKSHN